MKSDGDLKVKVTSTTPSWISRSGCFYTIASMLMTVTVAGPHAAAATGVKPIASCLEALVTGNPCKLTRTVRSKTAPTAPVSVWRSLQIARTNVDGKKKEFPWGSLTFPKTVKQPAKLKRSTRNRSLDLRSFRNDSFGAYMKALKEGKYTILLFSSDYCGFCKNMDKKLEHPLIGKYADRAIFSVTDAEKDLGARQLEEALGVVRYPTLVVLMTNSKNIHVAGRIEGEVLVPDIDRIFRIAMKEPIKKSNASDVSTPIVSRSRTGWLKSTATIQTGLKR